MCSMSEICACRIGCVYMYEQMLQLYPDVRLKKKGGLGFCFPRYRSLIRNVNAILHKTELCFFLLIV